MSSFSPGRLRKPAAPLDPQVADNDRVYLASRFARQAELRAIAQELERHGYNVTSRWLESPGPLANDALHGDGKAQELALMDLEDLRQADICIAFTEPLDNPRPGRGGRHTELGVALGLGHKVLVIGPREHVFHCLPQIAHYPDWDTARRHILPAGDSRPRRLLGGLSPAAAG